MADLDPRHLDWNLLHALLAVVETGSLTRAADNLGLSQPTLSRRIAALESAVGLALFERTARGLAPTAAGQALVEPALHMRSAVLALGLAAQQSQSVAGTVRLTASEIVSAWVLPPLLRALAERHPDIEVELVASNRLDNLLEREADIAIRMVRPTQSAVITCHLADWPLGFYAHRDHLTRQGVADGRLERTELQRLRWIGFDSQTDLLDGLRHQGLAIDRHFFAFRSDNHIANWMMVRAGLGVGIGLRHLAAAEPDLIEVRPANPTETWPIPTLPVWLTVHRELRASPRLRVVWDFLAEGLGRIGRG